MFSPCRSTKKQRILRLSRRWFLGLRFSGMWCRVPGWLVPQILKRGSFIFKGSKHPWSTSRSLRQQPSSDTAPPPKLMVSLFSDETDVYLSTQKKNTQSKTYCRKENLSLVHNIPYSDTEVCVSCSYKCDFKVNTIRGNGSLFILRKTWQRLHTFSFIWPRDTPNFGN